MYGVRGRSGAAVLSGLLLLACNAGESATEEGASPESTASATATDSTAGDSTPAKSGGSGDGVPEGSGHSDESTPGSDADSGESPTSETSAGGDGTSDADSAATQTAVGEQVGPPQNPTYNPTDISSMCPPCVPPPSFDCVGTGPCNCGPYICPEATSTVEVVEPEVTSDPVAEGSECRSTADCQDAGMDRPQCFAPGESFDAPPTSCGSPDWCGKCDCLPMPLGLGVACVSDADCPGAPTPTSSDAVQLTRCDLGSGLCEGCLSDADCSGDTPHCVEVPEGDVRGFRRCSECGLDSDCPSEQPHCVQIDSLVDPPGARSCHQCVTTTDCAAGICSAGLCVAECDVTNDECVPSETHHCNAETQRCEQRVCDAETACPTHALCSSGLCERRACMNDASCDAEGICVNNRCHNGFGHCEETLFTPAP